MIRRLQRYALVFTVTTLPWLLALAVLVAILRLGDVASDSRSLLRRQVSQERLRDERLAEALEAARRVIQEELARHDDRIAALLRRVELVVDKEGRVRVEIVREDPQATGSPSPRSSPSPSPSPCTLPRPLCGSLAPAPPTGVTGDGDPNGCPPGRSTDR